MLLTGFGDQRCQDESRSSGFALCISCYTQVKLLFLTLMVLLFFLFVTSLFMDDGGERSSSTTYINLSRHLILVWGSVATGL